jgi:hypothetical protein
MRETSHPETSAETLSDCDAEDIGCNLCIILVTFIKITATEEDDSIRMLLFKLFVIEDEKLVMGARVLIVLGRRIRILIRGFCFTIVVFSLVGFCLCLRCLILDRESGERYFIHLHIELLG